MLPDGRIIKLRTKIFGLVLFYHYYILNNIVKKTKAKNLGVTKTDTMSGINWSKVPTTKSKLDRILACQGPIKGTAQSDYRLLVKERKEIRHNKMYNDFLDELTKFNQAANMQGKQHDDAPDSLASVFTNVLGYTRIGRARSSKSREDLGT